MQLLFVLFPVHGSLCFFHTRNLVRDDDDDGSNRSVYCYAKNEKGGKSVWNVHVEKHVVYVGIYTAKNIFFFRILLRLTTRFGVTRQRWQRTTTTTNDDDDDDDRKKSLYMYGDDIIIRWLKCGNLLPAQMSTNIKLHASQK